MEGLSRLSAALKDAVKGRSSPAFIYVDVLSNTSNVSENFIYNVIEGQALNFQFGISGATWEHHGRLIRIPLDFGMRPL